jgi:glycosyltransferase involved in cell wall biosynthesis
VSIVDQNADDRLVPIIERFRGSLELSHLRCAPGVSGARNLGLRQVSGEVVGFPDDDCWFPDDLLSLLHGLLTHHPEWQAVIGEAVDESGQPILPWRDRPGRTSRPLSWRRAVTFTCFFRMNVLLELGGFDESLGPGAGVPWGSGEDNDLILRILRRDFHVQYETSLRVNHPRMFLAFDDANINKRYRYSLGDGRLLRKHPMPLWWTTLFFGVPLGRTFIAVLRLRIQEVKFHWRTFGGRVQGYRIGKLGGDDRKLAEVPK